MRSFDTEDETGGCRINREYLYILLLSLCRFEPIVSKLCSTNSHKMYKYSFKAMLDKFA